MLPDNFGVKDSDGVLHRSIMPKANAYFYQGEIITKASTVDIDTVLHEIGHWSHQLMGVNRNPNNRKTPEALVTARAVEFPSTSQQSAYLNSIGAEAVWPSYGSAFYYARPIRYGFNNTIDYKYETFLETPKPEWYRYDEDAGILKVYDSRYVPFDKEYKDLFFKGHPSTMDKLPKDITERKEYLFSYVLSPAQRRMMLRGDTGTAFIAAADQWLNPKLKPWMTALTEHIRKQLHPYAIVIDLARKGLLQPHDSRLDGIKADVIDLLNEKIITPEFDPTTGFDLMPLSQLLQLYKNLKK